MYTSGWPTGNRVTEAPNSTPPPPQEMKGARSQQWSAPLLTGGNRPQVHSGIHQALCRQWRRWPNPGRRPRQAGGVGQAHGGSSVVGQAHGLMGLAHRGMGLREPGRLMGKWPSGDFTAQYWLTPFLRHWHRCHHATLPWLCPQSPVSTKSCCPEHAGDLFVSVAVTVAEVLGYAFKQRGPPWWWVALCFSDFRRGTLLLRRIHGITPPTVACPSIIYHLSTTRTTYLPPVRNKRTTGKSSGPGRSGHRPPDGSSRRCGSGRHPAPSARPTGPSARRLP